MIRSGRREEAGPGVPAEGGHKMHGRANVPGSKAHRGDGYDHIYAAVDDRSRWAYVEVHADQKGPTCAGFLRRTAEHFASVGVKIEAVMTYRAMNYVVSKHFAGALGSLDAQHLVTRPYRPQTNGKGRTVQPHDARGMGLREALPVQRRSAQRPPTLARHLQSPQAPHRAGRTPRRSRG